MPEAAQKIQPVQQFNVMRLKAKIIGSDFQNGTYYVRVTTPAKDDFSHPQTFQIRTQHQVGQVGEIIDINVEPAGSARAFKYKDKETGQPRDGYDHKSWFVPV